MKLKVLEELENTYEYISEHLQAINATNRLMDKIEQSKEGQYTLASTLPFLKLYYIEFFIFSCYKTKP